MEWHIVDWMNKDCYTDKTFPSFQDARDFISEVADTEAYKQYPNDEVKREEVYTGICEDLYGEMLLPDIDSITSEDQARELAIDWQSAQQDFDLSYGELSQWQDLFTQLGEKYNLTDEFKENAII